ncbi:MAG: SEC-C metal-binding domain-containing protein, partial [Acidaminococcaceae bacterium]|nr:SEC-C metal-binding domain-containing protein [Acidaminococcaceae bacterium]
RVVAQMTEGEEHDYTVDEKLKTVAPTEAGVAKAEKLLGVKNMYDDESSVDFSHQLMQALKAKALMFRDRDYVVKDGEVIIVDEFTGRLMFGRRFSEGLHQAIEAKEGVKVERESQTLATITFQNYFRMYNKLSGMTGTAKTEEQEFQKIYGLDVVVIPTNRPMIRIDYPDVIYKTKKSKYVAAADDIAECHKTGRPVLVGTTSIQQSEELSDVLKRRGIKHSVLNAKFHEKEAEIIADAGQYGAVTIATNMAGRGTDIVLGEGVPELGGLHIVGTERHESRRIDNQLRGRCARQGDPGSTRFYLSLEDDLMRLFGSDNIAGIMDKLGMEDDEPIEHKLVTRSIESAQKKVESRNFDMRKHVLEYDDVMNQQREVIYEQRRQILMKGDLRENIIDMINRVVDRTMTMYAPPDVYCEDWDLPAMITYAEEFYAPEGTLTVEKLQAMSREEMDEYLHKLAITHYEERENMMGPEIMGELESLVMLKVVDSQWMEHLDAMDMLREGVGLRAYGQRDPLVEYKFEAYDMFEAMKSAIQDDIVRYIYRVNLVSQPKVEDHLANASVNNPNGDSETEKKQPVHNKEEIGRNDPCPCGSGKKFKNCCGKDK